MDIIDKIAGLSRSQTETLLARMRERREVVARGHGVPRMEPDAGRRQGPCHVVERQLDLGVRIPRDSTRRDVGAGVSRRGVRPSCGPSSP